MHHSLTINIKYWRLEALHDEAVTRDTRHLLRCHQGTYCKESPMNIYRVTEKWSKNPCLTLTNDGFSVMAGNVMESDTIIIEVVENSNTEFIAFSVVRLSSSSSEIIMLIITFILRIRLNYKISLIAGCKRQLVLLTNCYNTNCI